MKARNIARIAIRSVVTTIAAVAVDWFLRPSSAGDETFAVDTATIFSVASGPLFLAILISLAAANGLRNSGLKALVQSLLAALLACLSQLAAVAWTWPELLNGFVGQMTAIGFEMFVTLFTVNLAWEYRNALAAMDAARQD